MLGRVEGILSDCSKDLKEKYAKELEEERIYHASEPPVSWKEKLREGIPTFVRRFQFR